MVRPAPQGSMSLCERKSEKVSETGLISAPAPLKVETAQISSPASPQTETTDIAAPLLMLPAELISTGNRALRIFGSDHCHYVHFRFCNCLKVIQTTSYQRQ